MGCCISTEEKISNIFLKFKVLSIGQVEANSFPQLICGRIIYNLSEEKLICPIKQKQCVYYKAIATEQRGKNNHHVVCFTEERWSDFYLMDPDYPNVKILVPARKVQVKVRGVDDGKAKSGAGAVSFFESEQLPQGIEDMLKRHNFSVETNVLVGYSKKLMTYSEESFDVLEQLACLGIVKDGVDWNGQPIKVLHPIDVSTIPRSLFTERSWSGDDISTLKDLVEVPSIIASDDPYVFQGVRINQITQPPAPPVVALQPQFQQTIQYQQIPMNPQVIPQIIPQQQQQQPQIYPQQYPPPSQQQIYPQQYPPIQQQIQPQYQLPQQSMYNQQFQQQQQYAPIQQQQQQYISPQQYPPPQQQQQYPPAYHPQVIPPQQQLYQPPQQYGQSTIVPSNIPVQQYPQPQGMNFQLRSPQIYPS